MAKGWSREFEDPIDLPDGRTLITLEDPATTSPSFPRPNIPLRNGRMMEAPILVARSGPTMLARIGVMRALHRNEERVFNPDRKDHHWGKRKVKRDE
jgi:hypothetical protein